MLYQTLQDALFAAIAATGFAAISNPPRQAYIYCAILAACGHAFRFILMSASFAGINIIPATLIAALTIGFLAVLMASHARFPAETCLFPSLLPMIPGVYAYKAFGGVRTQDWHYAYSPKVPAVLQPTSICLHTIP